MASMSDGVRAVCFARRGVGAASLTDQRQAFENECAARGWTAGPVVCQLGRGGGDGRAWAAVRRLVRARRADVVVVDTLETIGATERDIARELVLLRHAGVRLLITEFGRDTADVASFGPLVAEFGTSVALAGTGVAA
ncbi:MULTISPECIES: resolvase [unclassified Pseudofrankia]|uniref:resolvase n=1 Tax=unclassified Pseudofrankia TaxID=2994372 RepID=UPI0008D99B34|nr:MULTISPECIES: resolvase [unclassified Pseudofrankia]MDT3440590.1 resolvase [Pseudofrankia sp. BMG5.37]OHV62156.1 resolvase [Pseudofrankia sp. BMG5.36]